jgi:hypothetical protein
MTNHSNARAVVEEKHWDEIARHRHTQVITSESAYLASLPAVWRDIHGRAYNFLRYLGKHRHEEETPLRAAQIAHLQHLAASSEFFYYKFFTGFERFFLSHGRWFHWFMTQLDRGCSKGIGWTGWHVVMALKKF